ncbi:uncharacterized protein LOC134854632 isoform X2 [Symsagittifera roscoffensis]|uniref:uncharacterized protein LOC134854632 isoform X2 n=1 Tax=Symsagittifera roscoffensis TaxID=84072 RepID=UPI00307C3FFE
MYTIQSASCVYLATNWAEIAVEGRQLILDVKHTQYISIIIYMALFELAISLLITKTFETPVPECRLAKLIQSGNIALLVPYALFAVSAYFFIMALYNAPFTRARFLRSVAAETKHRNGFKHCFGQLMRECAIGLVYSSTFGAKLAVEYITDDAETIFIVRAIATSVGFVALSLNSF